MQLLLAELKRIEGQQHQLKTAAAEHKVLIVHPVKGFDLDEEDEYAEEVEVKPDPDKFVPSGQAPSSAPAPSFPSVYGLRFEDCHSCA